MLLFRMVPGATVQSLRMSSKSIFLPSNFVAGIPAQHTKGIREMLSCVEIPDVYDRCPSPLLFNAYRKQSEMLYDDCAPVTCLAMAESSLNMP